MGKVAGIDCSSQFTQIVVCDAESGEVLRHGHAAHPELPGAVEKTEIDPQAWLLSLGEAAAGGVLEGVEAIGIAAQQHGMLAMDAGGVLVRPAVLWNDKRSTGAAADLVEQLGGPAAWTAAVGCVPQSAYPVAKLRWLDRKSVV